MPTAAILTIKIFLFVANNFILYASTYLLIFPKITAFLSKQPLLHNEAAFGWLNKDFSGYNWKIIPSAKCFSSQHETFSYFDENHLFPAHSDAIFIEIVFFRSPFTHCTIDNSLINQRIIDKSFFSINIHCFHCVLLWQNGYFFVWSPRIKVLPALTNFVHWYWTDRYWTVDVCTRFVSSYSILGTCWSGTWKHILASSLRLFVVKKKLFATFNYVKNDDWIFAFFL